MHPAKSFLTALAVVVVWLVSQIACPAAFAGKIAAHWPTVEKRLTKAGFDPAFVKALKESYEPQDFKNVVELNLLLFLKKSDHHGVQVTDEAVQRIRGFLKENDSVFQKAERDLGVPGPTIASLLWIESRYGRNLGRFHVASVFASLLQVEGEPVMRHLRTDGAKRFSANPKKRDLAKIPERVKKKSKWALDELKALQQIYKEKGKIALEMRGSFAGAFGMAQFLPSSYQRWARAARPGDVPDLNKSDDAIRSVAFYLHKNGWKSQRPKTHMQALLNYNNSRDYARAILRLAEQAGERSLASQGDEPSS